MKKAEMQRLRHVNPFNSRVTIIGAGLAGLSAAQHLVNNGFRNVTVLEAKNRIGGRIATRHFGQNPSNLVEMGANWIHGACSANSFFTMANHLQMLPGPLRPLDRMSGFCYKSGGAVVDPALVDRVWKMFCEWEEGDAEVGRAEQKIDTFAYLRQRLAENIGHFPGKQKDDVHAVFNCLINLCQFHNGGYLKDTPQTDIDGYRVLPGGNAKVPLGMSTVLDALVKGFPEGCIRYSEQAERITWNGYEVRIHCTSGSLYLAEHVILTLPLGVFKKRAKDFFDPELPEAKAKAVDAIGFGKVNKIFLQWDNPFWKEGFGGMKFAWSDEALTNVTREQWYKKIFAFDEVMNNPNVLLGWISGTEAEYMEALEDEKVIDVCMDLIRDFLGDPSIPRASRLLRSDWCSDPHTQGAYSFRNMTTTADDHRALAEPLLQGIMPRLLFAGEATSTWAYSTLHGARDSGIREAERLCQYYEIREKSNL